MKKFITLLLILAVVIGIPVSKKYFSGEDVKSVETEEVSTKLLKASILASGQLKYETEVNLTAEVIGKVSKVNVKEGDSVTAGQLILEIDDQAFVAAVKQQRARVEQQKSGIEKLKAIVKNLQKQEKRQAELFASKLINTDSYETVKHTLNVAQLDLKSGYQQLKQTQAQLEQAMEQLQKTKVISPITGKITTLNIKEGETAVSGTTNIAGSSLMTISNTEKMLAEINVDEADIANISIGQKAEIIAIAYADNPLIGTVESIASSAKTARGRSNLSFIIKLKLEKNPDVHLRPGMSCRAEVFTQGEQNLLAVPIKAILTEEDNDKDLVENFVFINENGTAKKIKIETGISDDSSQQVINGLDEGMSLITGPDKILRHLKDGEEIEVSDKTSNSRNNK